MCPPSNSPLDELPSSAVIRTPTVAAMIANVVRLLTGAPPKAASDGVSTVVNWIRKPAVVAGTCDRPQACARLPMADHSPSSTLAAVRLVVL
jgi:hypothetical protein